MRRFFSTLVSIALMLSAIGFMQTTFTVEASAGSPSAQRRRSAIRFVTRQIKESNAKLRYAITAKYPQSISARDPRLERLNYSIRSLITKQVADFKKNFEAPAERMETVESYFDTEYSIELATNDLISIHFYIDTYYEGAAHPNHNALTFNYSFETGKTLTLAELFKPRANYLNVISDYSIKALKKELGDNADSDWIQNGAGADEKNYRNWTITRRGLTINFDPYQVASYMEGPHEVVIPYNMLENLIDPVGPLSKILLPHPPIREALGTGYGVGNGVGIGTGTGDGIGASNQNGIGNGPGSRNNERFDPNKIFSPKEVDVKARLLSRPEPQMTEEAKKNDVNGAVVLRAVLTATGKVANIMVVSGLPYGLSEKAVAAARQIIFVPAMKNGRHVSQYIQIQYLFNSY